MSHYFPMKVFFRSFQLTLIHPYHLIISKNTNRKQSFFDLETNLGLLALFLDVRLLKITAVRVAMLDFTRVRFTQCVPVVVIGVLVLRRRNLEYKSTHRLHIIHIYSYLLFGPLSTYRFYLSKFMLFWLCISIWFHPRPACSTRPSHHRYCWAGIRVHRYIFKYMIV